MKNKTLQMNLQKFAGKTNVFPVSDNTFKVDHRGADCPGIYDRVKEVPECISQRKPSEI